MGRVTPERWHGGGTYGARWGSGEECHPERSACHPERSEGAPEAGRPTNVRVISGTEDMLYILFSETNKTPHLTTRESP